MVETKTWLTEAVNRSLISQETFAAFESDLNQLGRMLNAYIKSIGPSPASVREPAPLYGESSIPFSNDQ